MTLEQIKVIIKDGKGSIQYLGDGVVGIPHGNLEISAAKDGAKEFARLSARRGGNIVYGVTNLDLIKQSKQARVNKMTGGSS